MIDEETRASHSDKEIESMKKHYLANGKYGVDIKGWRMALTAYGDIYYIEKYKVGTDFKDIMKDDKVRL